MSLELGTFSNNASAARIDLGNVTVPADVTYFIWTYRTGEGGSNFGRVFGRSSGVHDLISNNPGSVNTYAFGDILNAQQYRWTRADAFQWVPISISGTIADTSTAPVIYQNGIKPTITRTGAGNFWGTTSSVAMQIGNRPSDSARVWHGMLAHFCMWDVKLTDAEHEALHAGALPSKIRPESIVLYFPLISDDRNLFGGNGTSVSCLFSNINPPVFDPIDVPVGLFYSGAVADTALSVSLQSISASASTLTTQISLSALTSAASTLSSALTTSIGLYSSAVSNASFTPSLTTSIRLNCSFSAQSSISAEFASAAAQLQSNLASQASLASGLTTAISLSSSLTSVASLTSSLSGVAAQLQAVLTAQAIASGSLVTEIALLSSLAGQSSIVAALAGGAAQLQSNLQASAGLTANLSTQIVLSTSLAAQSVLNAALTAGTGLAVNAAVSSLLIAGITTQIRFNVAFQSQSLLFASIEGAAINAPAGFGYIAGKSKSVRNVAGASSRPASRNSTRSILH